MAKRFSSVEYISSFVIGLFIGAGTALMLTPMTGRKLQRKVSSLVEDKVSDLKLVARRMAS